jgi:hypothetical protein
MHGEPKAVPDVDEIAAALTSGFTPLEPRQLRTAAPLPERLAEKP